MAAAAPAAASCLSTEHGCVMFDCLSQFWEWLDPPIPDSQFQMENKKVVPATQQPMSQQHLMAQHVHPEQIYSQQPTMQTQLPAQHSAPQHNGTVHQLLNPYHSNTTARSPLLENRHELYGTGHKHDYTRHYGANDNYNYPQSPPQRLERTDHYMDHNVNHELLHNIPKGYNAEVYQDYLKRNPPKETNQIYQNHQPTYRTNMNQQYGSKPYLPFSNRIGPQSNTELLRRQYNEIQQMKLQQQMHYQNQAQMQQQQKFAERQLLLQQLHGVQPPPNLQNSIYSDGSYRDIDHYSSKNDFKEYISADIQKDMDTYVKNNEFKETNKQNVQYQEAQWQSSQPSEIRNVERYRKPSDGDKGKSVSPEYVQSPSKSNVGIVSPMKSSESSSGSVKSPSSDSRRSSGGVQALRSPIAQRSPSAPVALSGILYKQGSDGLKVWRKRWFVLSEYCLFYYKSQDEDKLLGSVLLPSYKVSACTTEDKVLRKFAFKLEHANMRTYVLAAPDQESMLKWVKALTMAALMQSPNEQQQKQMDQLAAKLEESDEVPGPTYANAPPKPRRSNEGYNSPSPDMYDPNYDLLKKPASHYSQGTGHMRYQEHTNYPTSPNQEITYTRSPQSPPPPTQQQAHYQTKRPYDTHHLSLPLTNTVTDRLENKPSISPYGSNTQSPYFDNRNRAKQQPQQDTKPVQVYERQSHNHFLQDITPQTEPAPKESETQNYRSDLEQDISKGLYYNDNHPEQRNNKPIDVNSYNRDVYREINARPNKAGNPINERFLNERRTPDAYRRSPPMSSSGYNKGKVEDYEDVYGAYGTESEYGKTYVPIPPQSRDTTSISSQHLTQDNPGNYAPEKTFSGPSVLRRKKMQSSGIQPPMPRPHSADFLEYEAKNDMLNRKMPPRSSVDPGRQPQRPKSSLDINSYYDPSSDRYYSEESYAEKMRQSAQYLQHGIGSRNIQIPLAKYASGLAEKQLNSPYSQNTKNNYETEFSSNRSNFDHISYSKYGDSASLNCNWTLKEKENQKDYRSGSVMSDNSNAEAFAKDLNRYDLAENFMRSASARLPSTTAEKEGEKKVQQREESMKRLLEWKQRMLQSPLTRKSTPAAISLARSLNQSRQSLRSDQYKPKTHTNASYNSYSSDDEEEASGTDLQKPRDMQAGRSDRVNLTSPIVMRPITPHAPVSAPSTDENVNTLLTKTENTYENILCTINMPKLNMDHERIEETISYEQQDKPDCFERIKQESDQDGYETHESEAESETQLEYTDNDLDEVLLESEDEVQNKTDNINIEKHGDANSNCDKESLKEKSETPPTRIPGEDHYLPMSPRKIYTVEPAHKTILQGLSVFDHSMPLGYEDNPYVEMNVGNEEEDMQTYEIVCVNNGKVEPVYMELGNIASKADETEECTKSLLDTASNFADTKDQTLKRALKTDRLSKEKYDCSDADDEASKDISLDAPFSRFSISDNFRPASYYLGTSRKSVDLQDSSESEIFPSTLVPSTTPPCEGLTDEALSKYILDKLDKSDMSSDNSILKMLTSENQKMNTVKRKATSLMIYGSRTSIHDTLSRGEKIRNSRASLTSDRKLNETPSNLFSSSILEQYNSSSIDTDSVRSYNADRGSSRLSLESDISSKFDVAPSNISSEVASLNGSEAAIDLRHPASFRDLEMMIKRRPLSDDSIFELGSSDISASNQKPVNADLDKYLDNLQPSTSDCLTSRRNSQHNISDTNASAHKDVNMIRTMHLHTTSHTRCSSTPVSHTNKLNSSNISLIYRNISDQLASCDVSNSSSSSVGIPKSPISYYCKNFDEEQILIKNLNSDILADKIKEFEREKLALKTGNETNASSTTTGFHSRESSTEHSAPYYYSDLSSQEHINLLPTSHYLKNTNLHRKLNNQRRRGPLHKKNEISHIHNPIRSNHLHMSDRSCELAASARSVSVEFLSAADKDPDIDLKNIYESTGSRSSKIPESMNLISSLGCKRNTNNHSNNESTSPEASPALCNSLNGSSPIKVSNASMSSHCSENSSNTVYYDAEAEACAYENILSQGEKHWDEDALWRDNLRRVSHRHARSMDDLDSVPVKPSISNRTSVDASGINSIKRMKKNVSTKISRNVTYVNCDIQSQVLRRRENSNIHSSCPEEEEEKDDNDVYVSLAENSQILEQSDEGVYEQLTVESSENSLIMTSLENKCIAQGRNRRKFEIDRENLRQWDLMSSGLMKGVGGVRGAVAGAGAAVGVGARGTWDLVGSTDIGTDSASNEASMSMSGTNNIELSVNNSSSQQSLSKKAFLGSNTSIGRNIRDANIPVRAVSPRVRWVEEKSQSDHYGSQQMSTSQQNLHTLGQKDSWSSARSPSRASQPIRAVSPRVQRNENDDLQRDQRNRGDPLREIPTAGELLGRTHEELVLLLIQLRRRHAATHRAIEQCCTQIRSIEECLSSLKAMEREESLQRLEQLKMQLMELEHQYEKSKPLVQLVDNMVKLGSLYNRPGSTVERLERNQRLRHKVLAEHALEQQRWLESAAAGKPLETEAARARVAELWALEQELADEAAILQGLKTDKDAIESLLTGVRGKLDSVTRGSMTDLSLGGLGGYGSHTLNGTSYNGSGLNAADLGSPGYTDSEQNALSSNLATGPGLEAELARVHAMLAHNSKKLEQTVADNACLERELQQLRRALQARRACAPHHTQHPTAMLEDEVTRVQQLVTALQRQRQELSKAVRHLTQQSHVLQSTQDSMPGKRRPMSSWQETNLDTGSTIDHGHHNYAPYDVTGQVMPPGHYPNVETPLYVDTRVDGDITSPINSEDLQHSGFANLSNVEKQEIKTVRIVKRESERRQRDRERSIQPTSDWSSSNITANMEQFLEEELVQPSHNSRYSSLPHTDYSNSKFEEYYTKPTAPEPPNYLRLNENMKNMELSPKYPSSPSLSNYDYSRDISSLSSSFNKSYDRSGYDRTISLSTQYLNSPTDSAKTLTNDPLSKTSSVVSLPRSHMELSPIFKSEAAKQIITEMSSDGTKTASLHRRQVPKEKRRHYTAPHHLSAKTLNEMPKDGYGQDKMGRSLDDADMERALRTAPAPDVVRSALPTRYADSIDQLLAAPQKIRIPERYIPEKPPELSPEEQQKRQEKVESIKKMLSGSSADPSKSPDGEEKRQREHLLQMNQILAKQVTEMSKIIAVKALEELPQQDRSDELDDRSPDVELPIYQQRDNFFT